MTRWAPDRTGDEQAAAEVKRWADADRTRAGAADEWEETVGSASTALPSAYEDRSWELMRREDFDYGRYDLEGRG